MQAPLLRRPKPTDAHDSHSAASSGASAAPTLRTTPARRQASRQRELIEILLTFGPKFEPEEATAHAGDVVFFLRNDKGDGPPAVHNFLIGSDVDSPPLAASPTLINARQRRLHRVRA